LDVDGVRGGGSAEDEAGSWVGDCPMARAIFEVNVGRPAVRNRYFVA